MNQLKSLFKEIEIVFKGFLFDGQKLKRLELGISTLSASFGLKVGL